MNEVPEIELPAAKDDMMIRINYRGALQDSRTRRPLATNLPMYATAPATNPLFQVFTPPRPDPADVWSTIGGVIKRFGYKPPTVNRRLRRELIRFTDLWLKWNLSPLSNSDVPSFEKWLEDAPYSLGRKTELRRVWDGCSRLPEWRKWRVIKSFIKDETYPEYKFPRLINSRVDSAKCFWGPYVSAVADQLFKNPWFIKNTPVADRPYAISNRLLKPGALYVCTDYTAFEAHFTTEVMEMLQMRLFTYMFKGLSMWPDLDRFMNEILAGTGKCFFKFVTIIIKACRMSGEMDTSLSNGFSNLMLFLFFCSKNGLHIRDGPWGKSEVYGFVEGDDGIFSVQFPHLSPTKEQFAELGFTIKITSTTNFNEASFCGQLYDPDEQVVITDVLDALCRFGWTNKRYVNASEKVKMELLRSRGYSFYYQYNGCPILGKLGRRILKLTEGYVVRNSIVTNMDQWDREKYMSYVTNDLPEFKEPGLATRTLVEKLFNVSTEQQLLWEKIIDGADLGPLELPGLTLPSDWLDFGARYSSISLQDPVWLEKPSYLYRDRIFSKVSPLRNFNPQSGVCGRGSWLP